MDLYLLRYYLAVVETGSFTRAADRCFVSQPTLSAGIKKLEQQLGSALFERTNRRVFLTDAGNRFLPHAKAIMHETNRAQEALSQTDRPVLRLGFLSTLDSGLIKRLVLELKRKVPDVIVDVVEGSEQEIYNRLTDRSIDVAVLLDRGLYAEQTIILTEPYVFILQKGHALEGKKTLNLEDLADEPMVSRSRCELLSETSRYFTDQNRRPRLVYRTSNDARAVDMVEAGLGGTVVPKSMVTKGVGVYKLKGFKHTRTVVSVTVGQVRSDPLAKLLLAWNDVAAKYALDCGG